MGTGQRRIKGEAFPDTRDPPSVVARPPPSRSVKITLLKDGDRERHPHLRRPRPQISSARYPSRDPLRRFYSVWEALTALVLHIPGVLYGLLVLHDRLALLDPPDQLVALVCRLMSIAKSL